jgi:hypothetical protein
MLKQEYPRCCMLCTWMFPLSHLLSL